MRDLYVQKNQNAIGTRKLESMRERCHCRRRSAPRKPPSIHYSHHQKERVPRQTCIRPPPLKGCFFPHPCVAWKCTSLYTEGITTHPRMYTAPLGSSPSTTAVANVSVKSWCHNRGTHLLELGASVTKKRNQ